MLDLHPYTILLLIVVVLILKNGVNSIGKSKIQDKGWDLYTLVAPKFGHSKLIELTNKKQELIKVSNEKKLISAQDEYAKWTKLNRQSDKISNEINKLNEEISTNKTRISKYIGLLITISTSIPIWFSRLWFRKSVLFYFPNGVLPYYMEWVLSIPFYPLGSVGLTVWMFALNNVINSILFVITFAFEAPVMKPEKNATPPTSTGANEPTKVEEFQTVPEPEVTAEKVN